MLLQFEEEPRQTKYLKGADFEGNGLKLEVLSVEKVTANEGFGAPRQMVGLMAGETYRYTFLTSDNEEKIFDNHNPQLARYFLTLEEGDKVVIKREGKGKETRWTVIKL